MMGSQKLKRIIRPVVGGALLLAVVVAYFMVPMPWRGTQAATEFPPLPAYNTEDSPPIDYKAREAAQVALREELIAYEARQAEEARKAEAARQAAIAAQEKAAAEAAAKAAAQKAAEEKAAAAAALAASHPMTTEGYKAYAASKVDAAQFSCLDTLWMHESSWNPNADNPTSTAYGIPQFLDSTWASVGIAKTSDPYKQIDAGLIYIEKSYGSPCSAWDFWQANNWY
jgi:hypothetical protein